VFLYIEFRRGIGTGPSPDTGGRKKHHKEQEIWDTASNQAGLRIFVVGRTYISEVVTSSAF
jgi:hypothetical protein